MGASPGLAQSLAQPLADARAPFERLTTMLFIIAGLSVIGFASAAFWIARNITRPLADLTNSIDKIRLGSYDVRRARRDATSSAYWLRDCSSCGPP